MENDKYTTGDIVYSTAAPPTLGLLGHRGIISVEDDTLYIYHNTPIANNEWGGSTIKDTIEDYRNKGREIKKVKHSNLTENEIKARFEEIKGKKFNWISWNCDQFINYMISGENKKPLEKILIIGVFVSLFFLLKKSMKWK